MQPLVIDESLSLIGVGAYLPKSNTLVVSDLQLGQEGQLRASGHDVPYQDAQAIKKQLLAILDITKATRVVINGDLKHAFGQILPQERRDVREIITALKEHAEVVLVRGNHDTLTKPLAEELGLALYDSWTDEETFVLHGHKVQEIPTHIKTVIIGHLHPAVALSDGVRSERVKCFLLGTYQKKRLVILPSCTTLVVGADVLHIEPKGAFLDQALLDRAIVYTTDDDVRKVGSVRQIRDAMARLEQ